MNFTIIALMIAGICDQALFIMYEHRQKYKLAVAMKGLASFMFVLIGLNAFLNNPDANLAKYIFIGLCFGMLGDIFLNLRFVFEKSGQKIFLIGILFFLIGHILYLVALLPHAQKTLYCVIIGAVLAITLLAYIFKTMEVKMAFKIFGVVYLGAVIIMTCIALGIAIFAPTTQAIIYAIGAVLFTASDIVLIFNTFSGVTRFSLRITNLSLYYIGQLLIAISLFYIVINKIS